MDFTGKQIRFSNSNLFAQLFSLLSPIVSDWNPNVLPLDPASCLSNRNLFNKLSCFDARLPNFCFSCEKCLSWASLSMISLGRWVPRFLESALVIFAHVCRRPYGASLVSGAQQVGSRKWPPSKSRRHAGSRVAGEKRRKNSVSSGPLLRRIELVVDQIIKTF